MGGIFSLDSKFMRGMSRVTDLIILNCVFLLTCLPVITIGAATTALYTVCFRFGTQREGSLLGGYYRAFRDNFRQATLLWLFFLVFGGAACVNTVLFFSLGGWMHYLFALFLFMLVTVMMVAGYVFPLLSQFRNDTRATAKNALILSVAFLPRTAAIVVFNVLPWFTLLTNPFVFLQMGLLWVFVYFSAAAYINTFLLRKVFAPYMEQEEKDP
ncbi:MAG: YesL family protein [Faecousia sp.]